MPLRCQFCVDWQTIFLGAARRQALAELVENEKRLRAVVTDQTDLICRFQPDGKIPFANPAYCEFYGKPEPALLGAAEEHTSELQSRQYLVCRLLLEKKKKHKR